MRVLIVTSDNFLRFEHVTTTWTVFMDGSGYGMRDRIPCSYCFTLRAAACSSGLLLKWNALRNRYSCSDTEILVRGT